MIQRVVLFILLSMSILGGCAYKCEVYYEFDGNEYTYDSWTGAATDESDAESKCEDWYEDDGGAEKYCKSCEVQM